MAKDKGSPQSSSLTSLPGTPWRGRGQTWAVRPLTVHHTQRPPAGLATSFYCFLKTCLSIEFLDEFPQMGNKNNKKRRLEKVTHTFSQHWNIQHWTRVEQTIPRSVLLTVQLWLMRKIFPLPDNEHHFGSGAMISSSLTFCCVSGGWRLMQMEFSITAFYEEGNLLFTKEYQADFSKVTFIFFITLDILWQN